MWAMREIFLFLIAAGMATAAVRIEVKPGDDLEQALMKARVTRQENPKETIRHGGRTATFDRR